MPSKMKGKWLKIIIIVILLAPSIAAYFFFFHPHPVVVTISGVDHEVIFSGATPSAPSSDFFSSISPPSNLSIRPGGVFSDTISFHSIPSMPEFHLLNISVSSPVSSSFSIVTMNATLPLLISPDQTDVTILLIIRVPDSEFNGQITIDVTIGT